MVAGLAGGIRRQALALDPKSGSALLRLEGKEVPAGRITFIATAIHQNGTTGHRRKGVVPPSSRRGYIPRRAQVAKSPPCRLWNRRRR